MSGPDLRRAAAARAVDLVQPGMRLGIGTGSTANAFIALLGERVRAGLDIIGVPTSEATRQAAEREGIRLTTLEQCPELDLTIDGADELDGSLRLIKGGGGALLREKIVAYASHRMIVIADAAKHVQTLGAFPLPIEVNLFGLGATRRGIEAAIADADCSGALALRKGSDGGPYVTDGGHAILDAHLNRIPDPEWLSARLWAVPGVVEHGLFLGLASGAILAEARGDEAVVTVIGTLPRPVLNEVARASMKRRPRCFEPEAPHADTTKAWSAFMSRRLAAKAGLLLAAALLPLPALAQPPATAAKPAAKPASPTAPATPAANTAKPEDNISPSHLALAREVMLNSGIARSFDSIIPAFMEQIKKNAVTRPELTKDLDDVLNGLQPEMELQKQRMIDVAARIYAKGLTEPELTEIVAFFRSPAGKRYVETQPQLLDELVGAMQDWTQEVSEYMMVRVRADMGKRGHQLQ